MYLSIPHIRGPINSLFKLSLYFFLPYSKKVLRDKNYNDSIYKEKIFFVFLDKAN